MDSDHGDRTDYLRFLAMIGTSMVLMYGLMYLNSDEIFAHARFSETRLFMTMIMGGVMIAVMLGYMIKMYKNTRLNIALFVGAGALVLAGTWLVRSQATVTDVDYMQGMIPHHSIAILTSERARIEDVRVRGLADAIIDAQRREIAEMEWLIDDIKTNGRAMTEQEARERPAPAAPDPSD